MTALLSFGTAHATTEMGCTRLELQAENVVEPVLHLSVKEGEVPTTGMENTILGVWHPHDMKQYQIMNLLHSPAARWPTTNRHR